MKIIFLFLTLSLISPAIAQDFRNSQWGDTPEKVKETEKELFLLKEEDLGRKLFGITFIEDNTNTTYFTHTYIFFNQRLYGVRSKKIYLDGDNSLLKAISDYNQLYTDYKATYKSGITEKIVDEHYDLKGFQIKLNDVTHFISLRKEENDYYVVKTTFQNHN